MIVSDGRKCFRSLLFSIPPAVVLSLSFVFGEAMEKNGTVDLHAMKLWLAVISLSMLFCVVLFLAYGVGSGAVALRDFGKKTDDKRKRRPLSSFSNFMDRVINGQRSVFLLTAFMLVCWLPYFIVAFPGLYTYDAVTQTQWAIIQGNVSSFHPLIHTYWLSSLMILGKVAFGSYEMGVALYSLTQMAVMALGLSSVVRFLARWTKGILAPTLTLAYFCLFPLHPLLAISTTKDAVFSVSFVVFICLTFDFVKNPKEFLASPLNWFGFIAACFLASAFRNNALYVVLIALLFLFVAIRTNRKKAAALVAATMTFCLLYSQLLVPSVVNSGSTKAEMLGVPIQQLSRLACSNAIEEDVRVSVEYYIPSYEAYSPGITDPVKFGGDLSNVERDTVGFLNLWLHEGLDHPGVYLDAFVSLTYGYWDPAANYYDLGTTKPYLEYQGWTYYPDGHAERLMSPDGYKEVLSVDDPFEWIFIEPSNLFPGLSDFLESICLDPPWMHWGIFSVLISPGMMLQYVFIAFCYCLCRVRYNNAFAFAIVLLYFATCLLGPCFLIRYAYPLFVFAPLIPVLCGCVEMRRSS